MEIPKHFWRLAYKNEKDSDEMIRTSSIICPAPLQLDTADLLHEKITRKIRIGHGMMLANFEEHTKFGKVICIGVVTGKDGDAPRISWIKTKRDLLANSSAAIKYWRHSALFDIKGKRADELRLPALFSKIASIQTELPTVSGEPEQDDAMADILEILADDSLRATEKQVLVSARIGQGYFREILIEYWKRCPVTGLSNPVLLRASHIKPWAASTNQERLNPFNGILLTPNVDLLFDKGFVTFGNEGEIVISKTLSNIEAKQMGIHENARVTLESEHQHFLAFHRNSVFRG